MSWLAFIFVTCGNLSIRKKKKIGFIFIGIGSLLWMNIGLAIKDYALVMVNVVGTIIMVSSWFEWKRGEKYWNSLITPEHRIKWWQIWK